MLWDVSGPHGVCELRSISPHKAACPDSIRGLHGPPLAVQPTHFLLLHDLRRWGHALWWRCCLFYFIFTHMTHGGGQWWITCTFQTTPIRFCLVALFTQVVLILDYLHMTVSDLWGKLGIKYRLLLTWKSVIQVLLEYNNSTCIWLPLLTCDLLPRHTGEPGVTCTQSVSHVCSSGLWLADGRTAFCDGVLGPYGLSRGFCYDAGCSDTERTRPTTDACQVVAPTQSWTTWKIFSFSKFD